MIFSERQLEDLYENWVVAIYDDGGETLDRYTVVLKTTSGDFNDCIGMSENPNHPQGFCQFSTCQIGEHLGEVVPYNDLPKMVRSEIVRRVGH